MCQAIDGNYYFKSLGPRAKKRCLEKLACVLRLSIENDLCTCAMSTVSDSANSSLAALLDGVRTFDISSFAVEQTLSEVGKTPTTPPTA